MDRSIDAWRRWFLPPSFTSKAVTVSLSPTGTSPEVPSTLSNLSPAVEPPLGNSIELNVLARPGVAHQPHRVGAAQTSQSIPGPTDITLPEPSSTTASVPTKPTESIPTSSITSPPLVAAPALNYHAEAGKGKQKESQEGGNTLASESSSGDAAAKGQPEAHASGVDANLRLAHGGVASTIHASDLHLHSGSSIVPGSSMRSSLPLSNPRLGLSPVVTCDVPLAHASGVEATSMDGAITLGARNMVHRDHDHNSRAGAGSADSSDKTRNEHGEEAQRGGLTGEASGKPRSKTSPWIAKYFSYNKTRGGSGQIFRQLAAGVPGILSLDLSYGEKETTT